MRILVIEDNRDILANVLDYLQLKGYSVDCAQDGDRLSEIVPVQTLARQTLLELDDPLSRLEVIFAYLAQRKLV